MEIAEIKNNQVPAPTGKMRMFRVKAGLHHVPIPKVSPNGQHLVDLKTYKAGDIIKSDQPLHKKFPNKFEVVTRAVLPDPVVETPDEDEDENKKPTEPVDVVDVTEQFSRAAKHGFKVIKSDDTYDIVDEDDIERKLNEKPLNSVEEVKAALKDLVSR